MKKAKIYFGLTVVAIIILFSLGINAQELEVSPGSLTFATNPGSSQTQQLTIRDWINQGAQDN